MRPRRLLALGLLVPALGLTACGQSNDDSSDDFQGDEQVVAKMVEDLQDAGSDRDADKICTQYLTEALVTTIQKASGRPCDDVLGDALDDADSFELTVDKVAISGNEATVTVTSEIGDDDRQDTLNLTRDGSNWKLSSLGALAG